MLVAVDVDNLNIRNGPGTNYNVDHVARRGDVFDVNQGTITNGFVSIGLSLWASWQYLRPAASGATVRVTTALLNVRNGPGTNYNIVDQFKADRVVPIDPNKTVGSWYSVVAPSPQWISAAYTAPVTSTVPPPAPVPVPVPPPPASLPWTLPFSPSQRGVGTNTGGWVPGPNELALIRANNIQVALVIGYNSGVASQAVPKLRGAGIQQIIVRASTYEPITTAQRFLDLTMPILREYYDALGRPSNFMIAVHNEPNLTSEGYGKGWRDGAGFAAFFAAVAQTYRNAFPGCKLGFPAMSPGGAIDNVRANEIAFIQQAAAAVRAADWIGVHAYWERNDGSDFAPPINAWRQMFGNKPIVGTEIGPVGPAVVTPFAVLNAYRRLADAGIATMAWVLNGTGQFHGADWTYNNLRL